MKLRSTAAAVVLAATVLAACPPASAFHHPTAGGWMQRDPVGYANGLNRYEYAGARPGVARDPLGLDYEWLFPGELQDYPPAPARLPGTYGRLDLDKELGGPGLSDQWNPFGMYGSTGTERYDLWFFKRFPKTMRGATDIIKGRVEKKACIFKCQPGITAGTEFSLLPFTGGQDDVDITPDMRRFGDEPQNWWERNVKIGAFEIKAEMIRVTWTNSRCFKYSAVLYIEERTGADRPFSGQNQCWIEDPAWITGLFVRRTVRMADWSVSADHCCE